MSDVRFYVTLSGSHSGLLLTALTKYLDFSYPDVEESFLLARNLEEYIRGILSDQEGMMEVEK